jgi:hypothetical protein
MVAQSPVQADLGPFMPSRVRIHATAREVEALARLAAECARPGPAYDVQRAMVLLGKVAALIGPTLGAQQS